MMGPLVEESPPMVRPTSREIEVKRSKLSGEANLVVRAMRAPARLQKAPLREKKRVLILAVLIPMA